MNDQRTLRLLILGCAVALATNCLRIQPVQANPPQGMYFGKKKYVPHPLPNERQPAPAMVE